MKEDNDIYKKFRDYFSKIQGQFNILEQIILYIEKQRRGYLAHPLFLARRMSDGKRVLCNSQR